MSRKFFYRHGDETHGPVSVQKLRQMANDGTLKKADRIKPDHEDKWYVAGTVKGLFPDTTAISGLSEDRSAARVLSVAPAPPRALTPAEELSDAVRRLHAPEQGHSPASPTVNILPPRRGSSLGISALVLGILAFLLCWVPLLGAVTLPVSALGALLGAIGIVISLTRKGAGIGFPIAGTAVSVLALVIAFTMTSAMVAGIRAATDAMTEAYDEHNVTNQELVDQRTGTRQDDTGDVDVGDETSMRTRVAPSETEWAMADSPVKQGDVQFQVARAKVDYVLVSDPMSMSDEPSRSNNPQLLIAITLTNLSVTKKLDYRTWAGRSMSFERDFATLEDNFGNTYKRVNFGFTSTPVGRTESSSIFPNKTITDVLIFEPPIDAAEHLDLELPAKNFGGTGMIRIRIAMTMVEQKPPNQPDVPEKRERQPLHIEVLKAYMVTASHAAFDIRFRNTSEEDIRHWSITVEVYGSGDAYLGHATAMVSELKSGDAKVEQLVFLDVDVERIKRWEATLDGIVGQSGLRIDDQFELKPM